MIRRERVGRTRVGGQNVLQGGPTGVFPENDTAAIPAHESSGKRLVGPRVGQQPAHVNARFVREDAGAGDRLADRQRSACGSGYERGQFAESAGLHAAGLVQRHSQGDHDLFQRRIAGALAEPVDGYVHALRAGPHSGQRIRGGHSEIVVPVESDL